MIKTIGRVLLILGFAASCAAQTVYQTTDSKGRPVFTDQPPPGAKAVELPPVNTTPAVAPSAKPGAAKPEFAGYQQVKVVVPGSIPNGLAPVTVGLAIEPALRDGHSWQLSLDGQPVSQGRADSYTFPKLERGTHQLGLKVFDAFGKEVASSTPVDVFVFWPGKNR